MPSNAMASNVPLQIALPPAGRPHCQVTFPLARTPSYSLARLIERTFLKISASIRSPELGAIHLTWASMWSQEDNVVMGKSGSCTHLRLQVEKVIPPRPMEWGQERGDSSNKKQRVVAKRKVATCFIRKYNRYPLQREEGREEPGMLRMGAQVQYYRRTLFHNYLTSLKRKSGGKRRRETDSVVKPSTAANPAVTSCSWLPSKARGALTDHWVGWKNPSQFSASVDTVNWVKYFPYSFLIPKSIEAITIHIEEEENGDQGVDFKRFHFS